MNRTDRRARLADTCLYACTPIRDDLADFTDAVLDGGADVIQLRDKQAEAGELLAAAEVLREATARHGALFAVNDRADVALAGDADILHLGQGDLPRDWAVRIVGEEVLLGRSVHTFDQMKRAVDAGWDYVTVGPVYTTPTKRNRPTTGTGLLAEIAAFDPPIPWFAVGGLDLVTIDEVYAAGARRAVVMRLLTEAVNPGAVAARVVTRLRTEPRTGQAPHGL